MTEILKRIGEAQVECSKHPVNWLDVYVTLASTKGEIELLQAELAETQSAYAKHVNAEDSAWKKEVARLQSEVEQMQVENKRLRHIICILRWHGMMFTELAASVEGNVRIQNGRLKVWCLGEWTDVVNAQEEADAIMAGDEATDSKGSTPGPEVT